MACRAVSNHIDSSACRWSQGLSLIMLKIIQIAILMLAFNMSAFAEELKLECDVSVNHTDTNGYRYDGKSTTLLAISDYGARKWIFVSSDDIFLNNGTVTTDPDKHKVILDRSDSNKWHIYNKVSFPKRKDIITLEISIDRNTGLYTHSMRHDLNNGNGTLSAFASGKCSKVDSNRKKF